MSLVMLCVPLSSMAVIVSLEGMSHVATQNICLGGGLNILPVITTITGNAGNVVVTNTRDVPTFITGQSLSCIAGASSKMIEYHNKKKSKGVSNRHLQKRIDFDNYKDCLLNEKIISLGKETSKQQHQEKIYTFVSHNMKMYSVEQSKIALSWKDDKRIPMSHNKHLTYALGHYKTK